MTYHEFAHSASTRRRVPVMDGLWELLHKKNPDICIHYDDMTSFNLNWSQIEEMFDRQGHIMSSISDVIYHGPATIVLWNDGDKTVVKCAENDHYDPEKALAIAFMTKFCGKAGVRKIMKKYLPKKTETED